MATDTDDESNPATLEEQIKHSIRTAGLLFSPHPDCDGWKTTRAASPEVVAFTNKSVTPQFDRLAIEEDLVETEGGEFEVRGYYIETHDRAHEYEEIDFRKSHDDAVERVAEIMQDVVERRNDESS